MYILLFATLFAAVLGASLQVLNSSTSTISFSLPPGLGAASYTLANLTDETEISVIYSEMHSGNYGQYKLSSLIKRLASLVKKGDVPKSDARAFGRSSSLILRKKVYRMVSMASDFLESTGEYTCQVLELLRNGAPLSEFVGAEMGRGKSDSYSRLSMAAHSIREFTVSVDVNGSLSERLGGVSSYRFWGLEEMTLNEVMREFQLGLFGQQSLRIFMNTLVKLVDLNLMTNIEHAMWFSDKRIRFQERRDIVTAVKTIKRLSKTSNHYQEIFLLGQGDKSLLEFAQDRADIRSDPFWNQQIEKFNLAAAQKDIASRVELNDRGQVVLNLQPCLATVLETRQFSFINVTRNTNLEALWNEMFENPDVRKRADRFTAKAFELEKSGDIDFYTFSAMNAHLLLRLDIRLKLAMVKNALKDIAHGSEFLILQWMMGDATPLEFFNNRGNLPLSMISDRPEKWKEIAAAYYREQTAKLGLHELDPSPNRDQQVQPNRKRPAVNGDKRNPKRPAVNSDQRNPKRPVVSSDQRNPKRPAVSSDKRNPKRPAVSSDQQNPKRPVMNSDQRNPKRPAVSSDQRNPKRPVLRSTAQRVPDLPAVNAESSCPVDFHVLIRR